ncbi:MAG: nucleotidyltransferase domain-containing protein [Candidatus Aenigmatarchaeota archaeon]
MAGKEAVKKGKKNNMAMQNIKKDFLFLKDKVLAVLLYGSVQRKEHTKRSDIDICIIAPDKEPRKILKEIFRNVDVYGKKYDVHVFEEFPLYIKAEIIENHRLIIGDKHKLNEYFYKTRKIWDSQKHRQKLTKEDMMDLLKKE